MLSVNKAIIVGNIGKDPQLSYTTNNTAILKFSVATTNRWKDQEGEFQEKTNWHNIIVFGKRAEKLNELLQKGTPVYVEGRIQNDVVEKEEGQRRYFSSIIASIVNVLSKKSDREETTTPTEEEPVDDDTGLPF